MTDKLYYPDVFTTINIPKPEQHLATAAKHLFDVAAGSDDWDTDARMHLNKMTDTENSSQAFWEYDNTFDHTYDRLALTALRNSLIIAVEHRDFDDHNAAIRTTLTLSQGVSKVFVSDLRAHRSIDSGTTSEVAVAQFKNEFHQITARLGLYNRIKYVSRDQNESSSAIFASAA